MPSSGASFDFPVPTAGVLPHLHPQEVPPNALVAAQNWLRREGRVGLRPGIRPYGNAINGRPLGMLQYNHEDEDERVMVGTGLGWSCWSPGLEQWVDLSGALPLSGGPTCQVVLRAFNNGANTMVVGCNGRDPVMKWDGTLWPTASPYQRLGAGGVTVPIAKCLMVLYDRVVMAGSSGEGMLVWHSDNLDPDRGYTESAILGETPGDIVAMLERGNLEGVVYKETSIYRALAQEDYLAPFRYHLAAVGTPGPAAPLAVGSLPTGEHIYLANNADVFIFDGVSVRSAGQHISAWLQPRVNRDLIARSWLLVSPEQNEVWIFYPEEGRDDVNSAVVITLPDLTLWPVSYAAGRAFSAGMQSTIPTSLLIGQLTGTIGDQELTIGEYQTLAGAMLLGEVGGQMMEVSGASDDGDPISSYLESGYATMGDPRFWKTIHEVEWWLEPYRRQGPTQQPQNNLLVGRVGTVQYGERRTLSIPKVLVPGTNHRHRTHHRAVGRMFSLRLEIDSTVEVSYSGAAAVYARRGLR